MEIINLMRIPLTTLSLSITTLLCGLSFGQDQPELGTVAWGRSLDAALAQSAETGKPVFALIQEIPGRSKSVAFGQEVLADPLLSEAIADEFVPLLVINNRGGGDAEALKRLAEQAWGLPVVRFFSSDGQELLARKADVFDRGEIANRMIGALGSAQREVPQYLTALGAPIGEVGQAAFSMLCFSTGEKKLGGIDGVVRTEVGFINRKEVTRVWFDRGRISFEALLAKALEVDCANAVFVSGETAISEARAAAGRLEVGDLGGYKKARDDFQLRHLWRSPLSDLAMPPQQATKINALYSEDREAAMAWLSLGQRRAVEAAIAEVSAKPSD